MYLECPKKFKEFAWQVCEYLDMIELEGDVYIRTEQTVDGAHGECWGDKEQVEIVLANDQNKTLRDYRSTLAHELVHSRQFLRGELNIDLPIGTVYKNEYYRNDTNYVDEPWEQEAHSLEQEIMEFFFPGKW